MPAAKLSSTPQRADARNSAGVERVLDGPDRPNPFEEGEIAHQSAQRRQLQVGMGIHEARAAAPPGRATPARSARAAAPPRRGPPRRSARPRRPGRRRARWARRRSEAPIARGRGAASPAPDVARTAARGRPSRRPRAACPARGPPLSRRAAAWAACCRDPAGSVRAPVRRGRDAAGSTRSARCWARTPPSGAPPAGSTASRASPT